jgi:uncharacterized membrane protein
MKKMTSAVSVIALTAAIATALPASAQDIGQIAEGLTTQTRLVNTFITILAFVIGVVMAIIGLLKFKAHSDNPNDASSKLSTAFMLVFVGAALVAIPAALGSGIQTIFGTGAQQTDTSSGFGSVD